MCEMVKVNGKGFLVHAMKAYRGIAPLILIQGAGCDWLNSPPEMLGYPFNRRLNGPQR
jgi:hypothetical protein